MVADIADFFPHLYIHPLERTLEQCSKTRDKAYCVLGLLKGWNARVSYGVPVGPPAGRILADTTLASMDDALEGSGVKYCRYSDDFRIFCRSEADARTRLEFLAEQLFETYGLTLQPSKTTILKAASYMDRFGISVERLEAESLEDKFHKLLIKAGWEFEYGDEIDYDDLPDDVREEIDQLNLVQLFREQLARERYDPIVMTLLLQRLAQLDEDAVVDDVLANISTLEPVVDAVVRYLVDLRSLSSARRHKIGQSVLRSARDKRASRYQVACLLSVFTHDREFDNEDRLERLFEVCPQEGRRELMLALGRAGKTHWFVARRRDATALEPWLKRAFLAGASCMASDAWKAFFKTESRSKDVLELAVLRWVNAKPFA